MGRLEGKVAIVTGASRGTGAAIARIFVGEGARVLLTDVADEAGEKLAAELGDFARYRRLDVRLEDDWDAAVAEALEAFGKVDALVNNAAVLVIRTIEDTTREDLMGVVEVNQLGPLLGMRAVAEPMRRNGAGSIVNIASTDGLKGMNGVAAYASTKWALRGLTKVAAMELARDRIRVNAICPDYGSVEMSAPFLPPDHDAEELVEQNAWRILRPPEGTTIQDRVDDVARMAVYLASDECRMVTGADFVMDGGLTAGHLQPGIAGGDPL